ncbi:MAG: hypothetical protein Q9195_001389 [Heterodermia aff. obscurata]
MFWRFGGYASISTIDTILDKSDVTLEELLDESDLIQELKQHNTKLIEYLRDEKVLRRLLEYVIAPRAPGYEDDEDEESDEEEQTSRGTSLSPFRRSKEKEKTKKQEEREQWEKVDKARLKYAYISCEILSSETWSILEALMDNPQHLRELWKLIDREPLLDTTEAGYFTKIMDTLLDKKTEETLNFIKSIDGVIPAMLKHVDCPMIMDLVLKIISMEKSEGGVGHLSEEYSPATQTSAGDFIKAIITISANASQNEQSCIGPNNLTRQLVSEPCVDSLIKDMLKGGNPLTVGVGTIIEVIRKNNSDYDPDVSADPNSPPTSNDPIYLGTLLRYFAKHVPDFMALILSPTHTVSTASGTTTIKRKELPVAFGGKIEPLGFDRFKTCELMAELLHCSNMGLLNEKGSEAYIKERDAERERLKAEGALTTSRPPPSAATDFSEGGDDFTNGNSTLGLGSGSPEEIRRLEIANNADDDGFEDVGTSADLAEDIRDDFDEHSSFELESKSAQNSAAQKGNKPRLDLDEEFVDEPLTSPRLEALDEKEEELLEDLGAPGALDNDFDQQPEPEALSPTSGLSSQVDELHIENSVDSSSPRTSQATQALDSDANQPEPSQHNANPDAPPLPRRNVPPELNPPIIIEPEALSPHPDDKPAPLFAARSEKPDINESESAITSEDELQASGSQDTIDTTLAQEGDSDRSALIATGDQPFQPHIEHDVDGRPIVGDYLKMMFVEHRVVPTILDFFFRFPWNNFLHNVVYDVVQQVFNGPMDKGFNSSLAVDLFKTGRITERIVEGQQRSDEAQNEKNMRLGYMGHLTLIAEEVVKFGDRNPTETMHQDVLEKVSSDQWNNYVNNTLAETRERDNAILGGVRPDINIGPRQAVLNAVNAANGFNSGSNALAQAGLNGSTGLDSMDLASNGSATSSAFGISSGGSLLSGFGSSSDEEDEEMEDIDEGDGSGLFSPPAATSSTNNPLSTTSTPTSNPPSSTIPTIPPPLNVPPSRARRRLEARLNRHAAEAQAQLAAQVSSSTSTPSTNANELFAPAPPAGLELSPEMLSREEQRAFEGFDSGADEDDDIDVDNGEGAGEGEEGKRMMIPHLEPPAELHATPPPAPRRAFDLDDEDGLEGFANSPAGEGEEVVEAVVAEEERRGNLLALGGIEGEGSEGSGSGDDEEGVVMGMREGQSKAKGDLEKLWK